jgi:hypothetical protein
MYMDLSKKIFFSVIKLQETCTLFSISFFYSWDFFYGVLTHVQSEEHNEF